MTIQKNLLALVCATAFSIATFANTPELRSTPVSVTKDIRQMIKKLDLDTKLIENATLKIKFMVNENDELIIISTGDSNLDSIIKNALNYKEVNTKGLRPYQVYIVPVTFMLT